MAKLSEPEILEQMPAAKGWDRLGDMLVRTWQFTSPRRALEFVNQVAGLAELAGHFPEIVLNHRTVRIELSTHREGGLTPADFKLAGELNAIPTDR
jgi:4a-hydroxytetrahydrobiopterin dehydratase